MTYPVPARGGGILMHGSERFHSTFRMTVERGGSLALNDSNVEAHRYVEVEGAGPLDRPRPARNPK